MKPQSPRNRRTETRWHPSSSHLADGLEEAEEDGGVEAIAERSGADAAEEGPQPTPLRRQNARSTGDGGPAGRTAHHQGLRKKTPQAQVTTPELGHYCRALQAPTAVSHPHFFSLYNTRT